MREKVRGHRRSKNYREVIGVITRSLYEKEGRYFFDVLTEETVDGKLVRVPHIIQVGVGTLDAVRRRVRDGFNIWAEGSHSAFNTLILWDFITWS